MTRWYRAYDGTVTDPKFGEIALVANCTRSVALSTWATILEACAKLNQGGRFDVTPRRVAVILNEPITAIEAIFAEMRSMGMIRDDFVAAWAKRQFESDSSTERSRKHREAVRNAAATLRERPSSVAAAAGQRRATPPDTDTDTDTDTDKPSLPSTTAESEKKEEEGIDEIDCLERVIRSHPAIKSINQIKLVALIHAMSPVDRLALASGSEGYAAEFKVKPTTHLTGVARFITERLFENFAPKSTGPASGALALLGERSSAAASNRGHRLPPDWGPSEIGRQFAYETLGEAWARQELSKFADYWAAKPGAGGRKLDWEATWRNWVRTASERGPPRGGSKKQTLSETCAELAREYDQEVEFGYVRKPSRHDDFAGPTLELSAEVIPRLDR